MFKDKKEELQRLQAELLKEAELEAEEARLDAELEEDLSFPEPEDRETPYRNFANRYGTARNTDATDADLEEYSQEVYGGRPGKGLGVLAVIAVLLLLAILATLGWMYLRFRGVLS